MRRPWFAAFFAAAFGLGESSYVDDAFNHTLIYGVDVVRYAFVNLDVDAKHIRAEADVRRFVWPSEPELCSPREQLNKLRAPSSVQVRGTDLNFNMTMFKLSRTNKS